MVGLSPYKVGLEDAYAGNGRWEWANGGDILGADGGNCAQGGATSSGIRALPLQLGVPAGIVGSTGNFGGAGQLAGGFITRTSGWKETGGQHGDEEPTKIKTIINSLAGVMAVITILAIFAVVILCVRRRRRRKRIRSLHRQCSRFNRSRRSRSPSHSRCSRRRLRCSLNCRRR